MALCVPRNRDKTHCQDLARRIGARVWISNDQYHVSLYLFGKSYWTYRNSWAQLSSAMSVLADVCEIETPKDEIS